MNRFFSMDNKFFTIMNRVADLIILNLLFLVCSLPVVTIGASATALYYVALKMVRNEESYIFRSFLKSFKENFKQSTLIWVVMLLMGLLLYADFKIIDIIPGTLISVVRYLLMVITFLYAMVLLFIFPLQSKFENTIRNTFKNALLMSIRHLPYTLLMLVISVVPMGATLTIPVVFLYGLLVWILLGFSLTAFINSRFFVKIFDKYVPAKEEEELPVTTE